MLEVRFLGVICEVVWRKYRDGSTAICLYNEGPFATATVCLPVPPPAGCVWVKDYSENTGMAAALADAGVIDPTPVSKQRSGYVEIASYRLLVTPH